MSEQFRKERGPQGDQGQPGAAGQTGQTGQTGARGAKGVGFNRGQTLALIALVLAALLLMLYRSEVNSAEIRRSERQSAIDDCEGGTIILAKFNDQQAKLAAAEQGLLDARVAQESTDTALLQALTARVTIYTEGQVDLPDCAALPRP